MISKTLLTSVAEEALKNKPLFLVDVKCSADNVIEVIIDGMQGVDIDRCVEISKTIESRLNRDEEDYELTVSSAGIGDPLKLTAQFLKHENKEVEAVLKDGRKLQGIMTAPTDEQFLLTYRKKVEEEPGKKKKVWREFTETVKREEVKTVRLVIRF